MPTAQAVAQYMLESYHYLYGEVFKTAYLPYPQSLASTEVIKDLLIAGETAPDRPGKEILPIARLLLPALSATITAQARTDREVAALRTIEALRLYAHEHQGRWPKSLDEITEVPVPDNPVDGQPFKYRLEGETAILELDAVGGNARTAKRYELTLRK
jgi:hypothetical protein